MLYTLKRSAYPTKYPTYQNTHKALPNTVVSLRGLYGPTENQGDEGSCSAFASLQFRGALRTQAGLSWIDPSDQAQYFEERKLEGTVDQDSGATLEDALLVLEKYGVMPSEDDPYADDTFTDNPPIKDFNKSLRLNPQQVQKINQNTLLADTLDALNNGHPILFGFQVYSEMESPAVAQNGVLPMPGPDSQDLGGHAVNAIGFDPVHKNILVLNQWGQNWGIKSPAELQGCFWMPYKYYEKFCTTLMSDSQTINRKRCQYAKTTSNADPFTEFRPSTRNSRPSRAQSHRHCGSYYGGHFGRNGQLVPEHSFPGECPFWSREG